MTTDHGRLRQGHRLVQIGVLLFLVALLAGLVVPMFAVPRLGLSVHLLGIMQGLFLVALGLLWPRLVLTSTQLQAGCSLAIYGCVAAFLANVLAAAWGGSPMLPMASGGARSAPWRELTIAVALRSSAVALIAAAALTLWGLRERRPDGGAE
jgi:hydroxylaminobenzene mutase